MKTCPSRICTMSISLAQLLSFAGAAAGPARGEVPFVGVNPGAPIWGGSILLTDSFAADMASSGCRFVRINFRLDGNPTWSGTHLARYDQIIANARNHNLQILGLLSNESLAQGQSLWNDDPDNDGLNQYVYDYAAMAYFLIDRYKNDIKVWEIWNEPDCWSTNPAPDPRVAGCTYMVPKIYANLIAEVYKECNVDFGRTLLSSYGIRLSTGGLFAHEIGGVNPPTAYANSFLNQTALWNAFQTLTGRRYPWDYFGFHFYLDQGQAIQTWKLAYYFDQMQIKKNQYNDSTPFLVTEFGWNTIYPEVTEQLQADNLRDSYNYMRSRGDIAAACWYQWNNEPGAEWGLVWGPGNPKLSYHQFAAQCDEAGPPVAYFSADPTSGVAPTVVQFTNNALGLVDTYAWTFGDGGVSTEPSPSHEYTQAGAYDVTMTVTGPGGSDSATKIAYITIAAPPLPGDLDGDGDVDLHDFQRFMACFTGSGGLVPPVGCETDGGTPSPAVQTWTSAASLAGLPNAISGSDLLQGRIGVAEAGGFHPATPGGTAGGLADLTDGVAGANVEAVLMDFPGSGDPANRALQVRYDFSPPRHIASIRVFGANNDGRVFQNYDVSYSKVGEATFQTVLAGVTTGAFLQNNPGTMGATQTQVAGFDGGPIAMSVDSLRFVFYPVSGTDNGFRDAFDAGEPGDTDGLAEAFESSIIKEIDVFEYTGPVASNLADLDADGDADLVDYGMWLQDLTGPQ